MPEQAPPPVAVRYVPAAFARERTRLMGLQSANHGLLAALLRSPGSRVWLQVTDPDHASDFRARFEPLAVAGVIGPGEVGRLADVGALFLPGPALADAAWERRRRGNRAWSLIGLTHTISTHRVMDAVGDLLIAPVQPWDALVCTSSAVRRVVEGLLDRQAAYLAERNGAAPRQPVTLPVIPLGVDCGALPAPDATARRGRLRDAAGIPQDAVVALYLGRLSYHSKAHPTPMYRAVARAAAIAGRPLVLVQAGWFYNDAVADGFRAAAAAAAPETRVVTVDARDPETRLDAWSAADLFVSLTDNIQESFGLTPIEAMAAGLPVVASDWDGYSDTVVDGETGFLVPTRLPPAGAGVALAERYATGLDDHETHIGLAAMATAVDVEATARAIARLAADPDLRRRMGAAGRERARRVFDWPVVLAQHAALRETLAERRAAAAGEVAPLRAGQPAVPLRDDPFAVFRPFATAALPAAPSVAAVGPDATARLDALATVPINGLDPRLPAIARSLLFALPADGRPVRLESGAGADPGDHAMLCMAILWLEKLGIVRVADEAPESGGSR